MLKLIFFLWIKKCLVKCFFLGFPPLLPPLSFQKWKILFCFNLDPLRISFLLGQISKSLKFVGVQILSFANCYLNINTHLYTWLYIFFVLKWRHSEDCVSKYVHSPPLLFLELCKWIVFHLHLFLAESLCTCIFINSYIVYVFLLFNSSIHTLKWLFFLVLSE